MANFLSERGKLTRDNETFRSEKLVTCNKSLCDEINSSSDYVNIGFAENNLCDDIIVSKLSEIWRGDFSMLEYKQGRGTWNLRKAMANWITLSLNSCKQVSPDDLFCLPNDSSCIDLMAHCLADAGEAFLIPSPMDSRIYKSFTSVSHVKLLPIPIYNQDDSKPELTLEKVIYAYQNALIANEVVRGIFLTNPNNSLGDLYSPELLMDIMVFCNGNSLHLIVDEIDALSVFSNEKKFHSILKFARLPDPNRIHLIHGLNKEFGVAGIGIGVIHTKCEQLQKCLSQLSYFQTIPAPVMENLTTLLEDFKWCKDYISTYQQRLEENYEFCVTYLKSIEVKVKDCPTKIFLWMDLRDLCGKSFDEERKLFMFLSNAYKVYVGPGEKHFCDQPGWFRLTIIQKLANLKIGLSRIKEALEKYDPSKN